MSKNKRNILSKQEIENICQLTPVDITCIDCKTQFLWFKSTKRCSPCMTIHRRKKYVKKDNHDKTPLVIINAKGEIIGEVTRPRDLVNWYLENTKLKRSKLKSVVAIRNRLKLVKYTKCICYWICNKEDYSKESAIEFINRKSKAVPPQVELSEEQKQLILEVFKAQGDQTEIGKRFGMSRSKVNHIKTGMTYSKITGKVYERTYNKI